MTDAVLMMGAPWWSCGSTRVYATQAAYWHARGWLTVFVAPTSGGRETLARPQRWTDFMTHADEIGADIVLAAPARAAPWRIATIMSAPFRRTRASALDHRCRFSAGAPVPEALERLLPDLSVRAVHGNHVHTAGFVRRVAAALARNGRCPPVILDTHDVYARQLHDERARHPLTRRPDRLAGMLADEASWLARADLLIHLNPDEEAVFRQALPRARHALVRPAIAPPADDPGVSSGPVEPVDFLLVASLNPANVEGLVWFLEAVAPRLAADGRSFRVVGSVSAGLAGRPELAARWQAALAGPVAALGRHYASARVILLPTVRGHGIAIKAIEALAVGKPVVGTRMAFRGFVDAVAGRHGIAIEDEPAGFAEAAIRLASCPAGAAADVRAVYERLFTADAYARSMDAAIAPLGL